MLERYRRDYVEFNIAALRARFRSCSGRRRSAHTPALADIYERYGDLFTSGAIIQLKRELDAAAPHFESQRAALRHLLAFATEHHQVSAVWDLSAEIDNYLSEAAVEIPGRTLAFDEAEFAIAAEPDRARRRAISSRRLSIISASNDLRLERRNKLRLVRAALEAEVKAGSDLSCASEPLAEVRGAEALLERTERVYFSRLSETLQRDLGIQPEDAASSDCLRLMHLPRNGSRFPALRLLPVYRQTMSGLGISVDSQSNIQIDRDFDRDSACFPIGIPDEVKVTIRPLGGHAEYGALLDAAGRAQHYAWTAAGLAPEFKYTGDAALSAAYGLLFRHLLCDRVWLSDLLGFSDSRQFIRAGLFAGLAVLRRDAATRIFKHQVDGVPGGIASYPDAASAYSEALSRATGFHAPESEYLFDLDDGFGQATFNTPAGLRAWAFAAQLREYLKSRFGRRWWTSGRAGSFLKEIWETGNRYTADEMASQIGMGGIAYDQLIDELNLELQNV